MDCKTIRKNYLLVQMLNKIVMVFHKANELSSNITWVHSNTLFLDRASCGRAAC
jgi:hypothetical protein